MTNDIQKMSSFKSQIEKFGKPISKEIYSELANYANKRNVHLSGFRDFVGDIGVISN